MPSDGHAGGGAFDAIGVDDPFTGLSWGLDDPVFAGNTTRTVVVPRDERHPAARPVQAVRELARGAVRQAGRPVRPAHRDPVRLLADRRRLLQAAHPRGRGAGSRCGPMTFWTSYDTEPDWDHLFVEARTPGGDDWTTLPDANGHTTTATGQSCPAGLASTLHPQLDHYQTDGVDAARRPARPAPGTPPAATPAAGSSGASTSRRTPGRPSRSRSPTPATGRPRASASSSTTSRSRTAPSTSFETGLDGWAITGPPTGSAPNANNFVRTDASGFPVGAAISTPQSLLLGFGLEGVSTAAERNAVMGRAIGHLLD